MQESWFRRGFVVAWLAVVVQMFAPTVAGVAMARMALEDAPICAAHDETGGAPAERHHALCPICQVWCHGAHWLAAGTPPDLPVPRAEPLVLRVERTPSLPRAPPRDRPYARAPPAPAIA